MAQGTQGMSDQDKTKKILTIRRSVPREVIIAREMEALRHFEQQAQIARERLRAMEVAA